MTGTVLSGILHAFVRLIKIIIEVCASIIYYCGLYVPLAYLVYGGILYGVFDFPPFSKGTDGALYILGFALTLVCALMIAVKNLIIKPYDKHFRKSSVVEYGKNEKLSKHAPEAPKIYKSKVNRGVIVYEYENRYDLYEQRGDGLELVKTEYKYNKKRR